LVVDKRKQGVVRKKIYWGRGFRPLADKECAINLFINTKLC